MPEYTKKREILGASQVAKSLLENDLNAAAVARQRGTTRQNENKKARSKPVRDAMQRFLDSPKLKKALIEVGIDGLKAERITHAAILVQKDGSIIKAEEQGAIETKDHHARHKFWRDLMIATGTIKVSANGNGKSGVIIQVFYEHRNNNPSANSGIRSQIRQGE
jgi:hypothetical protein